jgi:NADH-quinone oxidoreductase subunit N
MLPVKISVLAFVSALLRIALEPRANMWQPYIAFSAVLSLIWGCFAALYEKKTKRFLAYASINQIGFLLLGLACASFEGYRATIIYLLIYSLRNFSFLVLFLNARRADGRSLLYLTDFRGLGASN